MSLKVIRVVGGLGNQIFCVAEGIRIECENPGVSVLYDDRSSYVTDRFRRNTWIPVIFPTIKRAALALVMVGFLLRIFRRFGLSKTYLKEGDQNYLAKVDEAFFIEGYFQDLRDERVLENLRRHYRPVNIPEKFLRLFKDVQSGLIGVIHVRMNEVATPTTEAGVYESKALETKNSIKWVYIADIEASVSWLETIGVSRFSGIGEYADLIEFELLRTAKIKCLASGTFSKCARLIGPPDQVIFQQ